MANPTMNVRPEARNQPYMQISPNQMDMETEIMLTQTMPAGPEGIEYAKVDAIDGRRPIMLNEMPKISSGLKLRRSSCL